MRMLHVDAERRAGPHGIDVEHRDNQHEEISAVGKGICRSGVVEQPETIR